MIYLVVFCITLIISARYTSKAADLVADWCVSVEEKHGEHYAWLVLFSALIVYVSPSVLTGYLAAIHL